MEKNLNPKFVCGSCKWNDSGFCDVLGWFVDDDDSPQCAHGKDWENRYISEEDYAYDDV